MRGGGATFLVVMSLAHPLNLPCPQVQRVVAASPALQFITMLGFSFGGVILRFTAALLFKNSADGEPRIAGLTPNTLMLCGSPNAGVETTINGFYKGVFRMFGGQASGMSNASV